MRGGLPLRPSQGANTVQPIRDLEKIRQIKELLINRSYRDYFLFFMGINSGLRISDILPLRVWDVKSATHLKVREKKTGNTRRILMTDALKNEIQKYCRTLGDSIDPEPDDAMHVYNKVGFQELGKMFVWCKSF